MFYAILEINPENLDLTKEEDRRKKEKFDYFKTTLGAKCILKEMATKSDHTSQEGYGILRPFEKVFKNDDYFRAAVNRAYENRNATENAL